LFNPYSSSDNENRAPHHTLLLASLVSLFNDLFAEKEQTVAIGGANEPLYAPQFVDHKGIIELSSNTTVSLNKHRVYFRHDYIASFLHEVAHWCIAGKERRKQLDYGYWYAPDNRSASQQATFEKVEVKPQALEKLFSHACGIEFRVSIDNFNLEEYDAQPFIEAVHQQSLAFTSGNLPTRASVFLEGIRHLKGQRKYA